jgi:DNA-binding NtrC family response regulator
MGMPIAHELKTQHQGGSWKGKLLLVDDDVKDLQRYSAILDELGYEVKAFSSYGEAAACLEREIFDMVVVRPGDLQL